jgi:tripartite-type tricarboxylate transporter receptor subunit TctC
MKFKRSSDFACRTRRGISKVLLGLGCLLVFQGPASAQTAEQFPRKPVVIVVPFAPGGTSDALGRVLGQKLSELWGQPVLVENRAGADGTVGANVVAKAPADGHTLLLLDTSTLTMAQIFYEKLAFDPLKDLAPVSLLQFSPHALVVPSSLPATSIQELVAHGKASANGLNFGAFNNAARLAGAQFQQVTGAKMVQIPYRGAGAAMTAVMAGEADFTLMGLFVAAPHVSGGKIRIIGLASPQRMASMPNIPTLTELGLPNCVTGSWQGLLAPAKTAPAILRKIYTDVAKVLALPDVRSRLIEQGAQVLSGPPEEFEALLKTQTESFARTARISNIRPSN